MDAFSFALSSMPPMTLAFIAVIALLTMVLNIRFTRRKADLGPTLLTMLGIFGCFLGIATGLLRFDSADIQTGVPALINGIKTSFWVSVAGIAGALIIKIRILLFGVPALPADSPVEEATAADIANLLRQTNQSLAGAEEQSLLHQMKLMRQDQREAADNLQRAFASFSTTVSEQGSKALIHALEHVIRDFNVQLTSQFGENFKQLNEAVAQVVIWQQQYRAQMAVLVDQETTTRKSMTEAAARFGELVTRAKAFSESAERLASVMDALPAQARSHEPHEKESAARVARPGDGGVKARSEDVSLKVRP